MQDIPPNNNRSPQAATDGTGSPSCPPDEESSTNTKEVDVAGNESYNAGAHASDNDDHDTQSSEWCCCICNRLGCSWLARLPFTWPRIYALIFAVLVPLYCVILLSMLFGYFLGRLEAPGEIFNNNSVLATRHVLDDTAVFNDKVLLATPRVCFDLYVKSLDEPMAEETMSAILDEEIGKIALSWMFPDAEGTSGSNQTAPETSSEARTGPSNVNVMEALDFVGKCSEMMKDKSEAFSASRLLEYADEIGTLGSDLGFNWIKCPVPVGNTSIDGSDEANGDGSALDAFLLSFATFEVGAQEEGVTRHWEANFNKLRDEYFEVYKNEASSMAEANLWAYWNAVGNADGFEGCNVDTFAR